MPLTVNLRDLDDDSVRLTGELPLEDLDADPQDEVIRLAGPLAYDLEVQTMEDGLLVQGELRLPLECQCVRCLKSFRTNVLVESWSRLVPLRGEEAAPVNNELVDLTPFVREDILLDFPQHPLCDPGCGGLPGMKGKQVETRSPDQTEPSSATAWAELNKLKFKQ